MAPRRGRAAARLDPAGRADVLAQTLARAVAERAGRRAHDGRGLAGERPGLTARQPMLQRLVYNTETGTLTVPGSWADRKVRWNEKGKHVDETSEEQTLYQLMQSDAMRVRLAEGLGLDWISKVQSLKDSDVDKGARRLAATPTDDALVARIAAVLRSDVALLQIATDSKLTGAALTAATSLVPAPGDLLPEAPDLGKVGTSVRARIPGSAKSYWEYTCVLIALYKQEGIARVRAIVKRDDVADNVDAAVQALHDHYVGSGVQYDDTSTRMRVMAQWGYELVFSGDVAWTELPKHLELKAAKKYIFDIEGHTVRVTVKRDMAQATAPLTDLLSSYFTCDSDKENYNTSEFLKPVRRIWMA